jgi:hypothetical protein
MPAKRPDDRCCRLRGAGRRRRNRRRAPVWLIWWSGRKPITALPDWRARANGERVVETEFPDEDKFDVIAR